MPIKTKKRANKSHRKRSCSWTGGASSGGGGLISVSSTVCTTAKIILTRSDAAASMSIQETMEMARMGLAAASVQLAVPVASASASVRAAANAAAWSIPAVVTVGASPSNTATMSHSASDAPSSIQLWTPKISWTRHAAPNLIIFRVCGSY